MERLSMSSENVAYKRLGINIQFEPNGTELYDKYNMIWYEIMYSE